jgi:hypothetical protein
VINLLGALAMMFALSKPASRKKTA